jgi:hypothetical protein
MAQRPKAKPKSKGQKNTNKKQSERFIETARRLHIEEAVEKFEEVFKRIVPARQSSD